jgi:hypothetical protein
MLPFGGRSPRARHHSYQAAIAQGSTRGAKKTRMLNYIREHKLVTYHGLIDGLVLSHGTVCSLLGALKDEGLVLEVGEAMGKYGRTLTLYGPAPIAQESQSCS